MDTDDRLRLDYEHTAALLQSLLDIRFKLLAFVPTTAGAAVGFLGGPRPPVELLAIGTLGLVATLGVFAYDARTSEAYGAAVRRAGDLEKRLGLSPAAGGAGPGASSSDSRGGPGGLFGMLEAGHDRGLALVYGAALAGWSYLVAWGALTAIGVADGRAFGALVGALVGLVVILGAWRIGGRGEPAPRD